MNIVILMGRLTKDPEVRYTKGDRPTAVASFSLAVDRRFKREGQADVDYFDCKTFGKTAEIVEKYVHKGTKITVQGRLQNDNYTNREGKTVYRNSVIVDAIEFAESKNASQSANQGGQAPRMTGKTPSREEDNFMNIPDGIAEDELPFN